MSDRPAHFARSADTAWRWRHRTPRILPPSLPAGSRGWPAGDRAPSRWSLSCGGRLECRRAGAWRSWPPLSSLFQRRARPADAGLAHVAAVTVRVVTAAGMEKAAVIPEDDVA